MNVSEMRDKTEKELRDELIELRKEQFKLRMQNSTGQMSRNHEFSRVRKDIARLKTVLNEKSRASK